MKAMISVLFIALASLGANDSKKNQPTGKQENYQTDKKPMTPFEMVDQNQFD